jgi:hypothetical protein
LLILCHSKMVLITRGNRNTQAAQTAILPDEPKIWNDRWTKNCLQYLFVIRPNYRRNRWLIINRLWTQFNHWQVQEEFNHFRISENDSISQRSHMFILNCIDYTWRMISSHNCRNNTQIVRLNCLEQHLRRAWTCLINILTNSSFSL